MNYLATNPDLKEKVRLLRLFSGLSQSELAAKLDGSQAWLSKVEAGKLELSARHLSLLRTIFGLSCDAILDGIIPYHEIALKMNAEQLIPSKYTDNAHIPMKTFYPILNSIPTSESVETLALLARKLSIKPFVLNDSALLMNEVFLDAFFREISAKGCWSTPTHFELLKENLSLQNPAQFVKSISRSEKFDTDFINKLKTSIFDVLLGGSGPSGLLHQI